MVQENDTERDAETDEQQGWSRRTLLRTSGAGIGLATALGITAAGQEGNGDGDGAGNETNGNETNGNETAAGDSSTVFDDLVDPTWGYPLAADESEAVDVEQVVEMRTEEGEGDHSGFPVDPESGEEMPVEFMFDPVGLHVEPGQLVKFTTMSGEHTATAFHDKFGGFGVEVPTRVPEDVPGFTSPPLVEDESWLYQFSTPGVYDVVCLPHLYAGMVMRIVVADPEEDMEGDSFTAQPTDNLPPSVVAVFDAEELTPSNIVDSGSVAWADLTLEQPDSTTTDDGTTTEPDGTTTEPDGNTTEPGGNTTEPGGNTTEPGGNTTEPGGNTTEPGGNTTDTEGN